jgi:hypothetical protein
MCRCVARHLSSSSTWDPTTDSSPFNSLLKLSFPFNPHMKPTALKDLHHHWPLPPSTAYTTALQPLTRPYKRRTKTLEETCTSSTPQWPSSPSPGPSPLAPSTAARSTPLRAHLQPSSASLTSLPASPSSPTPPWPLMVSFGALKHSSGDSSVAPPPHRLRPPLPHPHLLSAVETRWVT